MKLHDNDKCDSFLTPEMKQVMAKSMQIAMEQHIPFPVDSTFYMGVDMATRNIALGLKTYLINNGVHKETVKVYSIPMTWWDAFKEEYLHKLPEILSKRFKPIEYKKVKTEINHIHACPHHDTQFGKEHISFLITDDVKSVHQSKTRQQRIEELKKLLQDGHVMIPTRFDGFVAELRDLEREERL